MGVRIGARRRGFAPVSLKSKKFDFKDTLTDIVGVSEENGHRQRSISLYILSEYLTKMSEKI